MPRLVETFPLFIYNGTTYPYRFLKTSALKALEAINELQHRKGVMYIYVYYIYIFTFKPYSWRESEEVIFAHLPVSSALLLSNSSQPWSLLLLHLINYLFETLSPWNYPLDLDFWYWSNSREMFNWFQDFQSNPFRRKASKNLGKDIIRYDVKMETDLNEISMAPA